MTKPKRLYIKASGELLSVGRDRVDGVRWDVSFSYSVKADRKYGVPGRRMCLFLGMWTGNVRLPCVSGPPLNKQASCLGSQRCCLEIMWDVTACHALVHTTGSDVSWGCSLYKRPLNKVIVCAEINKDFASHYVEQCGLCYHLVIDLKCALQ